MTDQGQERSAESESRYHTLLRISSAVATQPNVQAVVRSLAGLLSTVVTFDSVALLLLDDARHTLTLHALERGVDDLGIEVGTEIAFAGTAVARAIEEQVPIFIPDAKEEMRKIPQLAARMNVAAVHSSYVFPVSTSRKKLGALVFGTREHAKFSPDDLELMSSVAEHVSVSLETALANQAAEVYQRELARERDRLKLLLEINNHIVTKLDVNDLFRAASASIRWYFDNDFTSFWLFEEQSNRLKCAVLDFPESRGFLADISVTEVSQGGLNKLRTRTPTIMAASDIAALPAIIVEVLKAESIVTVASAPLITAAGPIGVITLGSRRDKSFGQADLDLLSQVADQISLALDNALAYGRLAASRNRLEDERLYLESEIRSEYNFEDIVGKSSALHKVLEQVSIVAPTDSTVLLLGETGTGK